MIQRKQKLDYIEQPVEAAQDAFTPALSRSAGEGAGERLYWHDSH